MNEALLEVARQVPGLLALVWLVWKMMGVVRHFTDTVQTMQASCHTVQRESVAAISANTEVLRGLANGGPDAPHRAAR